MLRERGDELIDRYCSAIQNAERTAINAVKKQREETARARDQRSSLAGTLARILLDAIDHGEDPVSRTLQEVGEQRPQLSVCLEGRTPFTLTILSVDDEVLRVKRDPAGGL